MIKRKVSVWRRMIRLLIFLILLGVLVFGLALGALCLAESSPAPADPQSDAIIVLGCQVYPDGSPSPQLELRLESALAAYNENPRLIVACGGQGSGEPRPEGQVMRDWLIARGVREDDVIPECDSFNTRQNLKNAKALLPQWVRSVTLITSDYHLPRALALARDLGFDAGGIGSPCKPEYWLKNHTRELLAWGKYWTEKITGAE